MCLGCGLEPGEDHYPLDALAHLFSVALTNNLPLTKYRVSPWMPPCRSPCPCHATASNQTRSNPKIAESTVNDTRLHTTASRPTTVATQVQSMTAGFRGWLHVARDAAYGPETHSFIIYHPKPPIRSDVISRAFKPSTIGRCVDLNINHATAAGNAIPEADVPLNRKYLEAPIGDPRCLGVRLCSDIL